MLRLSRQCDINKDFVPVDYDGWTVLGCGGGGSMFFPAISPFSNNVFALACDMTGTNFTYDGGRSWTLKCIKSRVDEICFDPNKEGVVYAGSSGLYRSDDNGLTWCLIFPNPTDIRGEHFVGDEALHVFETNTDWPGGKVQSIYVDPECSKNIFIGVATGFGIEYDGDELVFFMSSDSGASWSKGIKVPGLRFCKIYKGNGRQYKNSVFITTSAGFYRYDIAASRLSSLTVPTQVKRITQADAGLNPDTGESVFFFTSNPSFKNNEFRPGVYRSTDYGGSWKELEGLNIDYAGPSNGQFRRYHSIAVCANDARKVYLGNWTWPDMKDNPQPMPNYKGVLTSSDLGETWDWSMKIGFELPDNMECGWHEECYDTDWLSAPLHIAAAPSDTEFAFCVTMGTVFKTVDGGLSWQQSYSQRFKDDTWYGNGLETTGVNTFHIDPHDKNNQYLTCSDNGVLISRDAGKTWRRTANGVPSKWVNTCYNIVFDPDIPGKLWATRSECHNLVRENMFRNDRLNRVIVEGGVCMSENCGESWTVASNGINTKGSTARFMILDPRSSPGSRTLYVAQAGAGVYKSTDDGRSWVLKNNGLGDNLYTLQVLLMPDGTLYLTVMRTLFGMDNKINDGGIYKSIDGAESWQRLSLPAGVNAPNDLDYDSDDLYLACWPKNDEGCNSKGGLFKSVDGGASWSCVYDASEYVYGVTADKKNPGTIYIATFTNEVLVSRDTGSTWKPLVGFDFKWNHKVFMDPCDDNKVYISTFGSSVWHGEVRTAE